MFFDVLSFVFPLPKVHVLSVDDDLKPTLFISTIVIEHVRSQRDVRSPKPPTSDKVWVNTNLS